MSNTKELIVHYRKRSAEPAPLHIDRAVVERVESFKFLGVDINNKLSWSKHTDMHLLVADTLKKVEAWSRKRVSICCDHLLPHAAGLISFA